MAHKRTATLVGIAATTALLAGLWWLIAEGRPDAWLVGVPAVALAVLASARLSGGARSRLSLAGWPGFIALFLRESLAGGIVRAGEVLENGRARETLDALVRVTNAF